MADFREFTFWSVDFSGDDLVDGDGFNAPVFGEFPLDPGETASVFLKTMTYLGTDGADGAIFEDPIDKSLIYVSDTNQLIEGDSIPTPVDEPLPLDPNEPPADGGDPPAEGNMITGTEGSDQIQPGFVSEGVTGGPPSDADDVIDALGGDDAVAGGGGDDTIDGGAGQDILDGGDGNDTLRGGARADSLTGGTGNDTLNGGEGRDILQGGAGDDSLDGGDDGDILDGGAGNDTLEAGRDDKATDNLTGGPGNDRFVFAGENGFDTVKDFVNGSDKIDLSAYDVSDVSDLEISQTGPVAAGGVTIISGYTDNPEENIISLDGVRASDLGNEDFIFSGEPPEPPVEDGKITGTAEADIITPGFVSGGVTGGAPSGADDTISALAGNDTVDGGGGNDTIDGGTGDDALKGGDGDDRLLGNDGEDDLDGGDGNDFLLGGERLDFLDGGTGDDVLMGGEDNDNLQGGEGADTLFGGSGWDVLNGGNGNDFLNGGEDTDWLIGGNGDDVIDGGEGIDLLIGGDGKDVLYGGAGNDRLEAGFDDNDSDTLTGDAGNDKFAFGGANGQDSITDFTDGEDIIDLSDYADVNAVCDLDIEQQGNDAVISGYDGADNSIVVENFDANDLTNEDFNFA